MKTTETTRSHGQFMSRNTPEHFFNANIKEHMPGSLNNSLLMKLLSDVFEEKETIALP